jgi:1-acyl-sn-glycerol-3-phosphate acyltransferase
MLSATAVKFINILPGKLARYIPKKIVDKYLKKYANIHIEGEKN